jgi:DNA-binding response OmpR family regulator
VIIGDRSLRFSRNEYKLMQLLFTHRVVKEALLAQTLALPEKEKATSKTIAKYVNTLRSKLSPNGVGVGCVHGYGYMLLSEKEHAQKDLIKNKAARIT